MSDFQTAAGRGGWVKGSRKTNLPLMIKLAEEGYAAVSVQCRLQ